MKVLILIWHLLLVAVMILDIIRVISEPESLLIYLSLILRVIAAFLSGLVLHEFWHYW